LPKKPYHSEWVGQIFRKRRISMTKKIMLTLLFVLLASLFYTGEALAVAQTPGTGDTTAQGGRLTHGTLTEIGGDTFTIQTPAGGTFTYQVDADTAFRIKDLEAPTFADLETGMHLAVAARIIDGERVARMVVVTPDDFDPSHRFGVRVRGVIVDIDQDASTLTLEKPSGGQIVFQVGERTRFIGKAQSLGDLQLGWAAAVAGGRDGDGVFHAALVATLEHPRPVVLAGEVTGVDHETGTFTVLTRRDETVTIQVDADTVFHSREGAVQELADLQTGMVAAVTGLPEEDGTILAKRVAAGSKDDLPDFDIKAGGRLTVVGMDFFTLRTKDGDEITFTVNRDTHFRGRGVNVRRITDLRVGMIVLVGGDEGGDGENIARSVIAVQAPGR
jgi:hypothetical protein